MWELDHKEGRVTKIWCFQTVMLGKTLESPLDCKKVKPVNPKGNQSWIFIGRTYAKAESPILWPSEVKSWLIRIDSTYWRKQMLGKIEGKRKRGWQNMRCLDSIQLNGHEFEQTPGDREGQGSLAYCSPWGHKESDTTFRLNNKFHQICFGVLKVTWWGHAILRLGTKVVINVPGTHQGSFLPAVVYKQQKDKAGPAPLIGRLKLWSQISLEEQKLFQCLSLIFSVPLHCVQQNQSKKSARIIPDNKITNNYRTSCIPYVWVHTYIWRD